MPDYARLRAIMVDTQVRPSDVTKFPIIEAMLAVPRERFVPDSLREMAYVGENLRLAPGRVLLEPRTLAKLLDALDIRANELVLDVGSALGYSAAVIARLAEAVVAIEEDENLAREAEALLADTDVDNVAALAGPLALGATKHGPYDVIVVEGAAEKIPVPLVKQLKEGGRIGCLFLESNLGIARIGRKVDGRVGWRFAFNASAPVIPGFEMRKEFAL